MILCSGSKKRYVISQSRYLSLESGIKVLRPTSRVSNLGIHWGVSGNRVEWAMLILDSHQLDGERMQLHMISDDEMPGGKRFGFWSRKAKEYTYLYGNGFEDPNSALTRHLKEAFDEGVENIVLDGEMITWDPEQDAMVPFGYVQFGAVPPFIDTKI